MPRATGGWGTRGGAPPLLGIGQISPHLDIFNSRNQQFSTVVVCGSYPGAAAFARRARMEFFTHTWCPFAHRVWLSLEDKQIPYRLVEIDLYGSRNHSEAGIPPFLELNPKGLVPVLRHEGRVICESNDICEYLEQISAGAGAAAAAGKHGEWMQWGGDELLPKGRKAILGGSAKDKQALLEALHRLDDHLASQTPEQAAIGGPSDLLTLADCSLFPMLWRIRERGAGGYAAVSCRRWMLTLQETRRDRASPAR